MQIASIEQTSNTLELSQKKKSQISDKSFQSTLSHAINEVDQKIKNADFKMESMVTGANKDIHGVMIAMEQAEISTRLLLAVKNKVTSAYQEISRMSI